MMAAISIFHEAQLKAFKNDTSLTNLPETAWCTRGHHTLPVTSASISHTHKHINQSDAIFNPIWHGNLCSMVCHLMITNSHTEIRATQPNTDWRSMFLTTLLPRCLCERATWWCCCVYVPERLWHIQEGNVNRVQMSTSHKGTVNLFFTTNETIISWGWRLKWSRLLHNTEHTEQKWDASASV